jgi:hypothetical protein
VVTLVLYTYFIAALMGRQMVPHSGTPANGAKYEDPDLYFPLFTALQVGFTISLLLDVTPSMCQIKEFSRIS